jgi:release factor glutamine methyltransferase
MATASDRVDSAQLKVLVGNAIERLGSAGIGEARLEAELLMAFAAGVTRERLLADMVVVDDTMCERFAKLVDLRAARMPLAYVLGRREFYSLEVQVSHEVLIPRPETETLVAAALTYIGGCADARVIDLGTGSGAIAIAIGAKAPHVHVVATDISPGALAIAARNAGRLGVAARVEFRQADCWTAIDDGEPLGRFDLIVANPPYIREDEIASLAPEIRDYEPYVALAGGADGLTFYRRIAADAKNHLTADGSLMVEVGQGQADDVAAIFRAAGLGEIDVLNDLAGIARVVKARAA